MNDVVLTPEAAWFTDSFNPVLYKLPSSRSGRLPAQGEVVTVPLSGDVAYEDGFNLNGISRTPEGSACWWSRPTRACCSASTRPPASPTRVDLDGEPLPNGDGLLLDGRTLYVVRNVDDEVAVVRLDRIRAPRRRRRSSHRPPLRRADHRRPLRRPALPPPTPGSWSNPPTTAYSAVAIPAARP